MTKFLVDESCGRKLCLFLRQKSFDALFVGDVFPSTLDQNVLSHATTEQRVLITNDKDFGELLFRLRLPSAGVIFLRLKNDTPLHRQEAVLDVITTLSNELSTSFIIATEGKVRVRKLNAIR